MRTLVSMTFFLLAAWFLTLSGVGAIPELKQEPIPHSLIERAPRRTSMRDPAVTKIGGLDQSCQSCHSIFTSTAEEPADRMQHKQIVLEHGMNSRCDNCHTKGDHQQLALYGGKEIGYDHVEELCAKCHGPTYRDWQRGMHGKAMGSWERDSAERHQLVCTECHDPHHPAFEPIVPLRGPHTLRQHATQQKGGAGHGGKQNPLRQWYESHGSAPSQQGSH